MPFNAHSLSLPPFIDCVRKRVMVFIQQLQMKNVHSHAVEPTISVLFMLWCVSSTHARKYCVSVGLYD